MDVINFLLTLHLLPFHFLKWITFRRIFTPSLSVTMLSINLKKHGQRWVLKVHLSPTNFRCLNRINIACYKLLMQWAIFVTMQCPHFKKILNHISTTEVWKYRYDEKQNRVNVWGFNERSGWATGNWMSD